MAKEKITGAMAVRRALEAEGVEYIFGMPGGTIIPIYDALFQCKKPLPVLIRHEQVGGHAAEGFAHATGKVGVCIGTSGPGATNLVTAIADAYLDSVPLVAHHRERADHAHRLRRVPGGRHHRHHDADHQAQLARHRRPRPPAHPQGGLLRRADGPPRAGARGHPEGRPEHA